MDKKLAFIATALLTAAAALAIVPADAASSGVTLRASESTTGGDPDGESSRTVISGNGRYIVYHSEANNLVANDGYRIRTDVFRTDVVTGKTDLVSVAYDGGPANDESTFPAISYDGRYVAFQSEATNLVPGDTAAGDVFRRDMVTGVTEKVSIGVEGARAQGLSTRPSISWDGRIVAFNSAAANLVAGDTNGATDAFVRDMATGVNTRISDTIEEPSDGDSIRAIVSGDGQYVVFASAASNLVPGDTNGQPDIFRWERATGKIERASVTSAGGNIDKVSQRPWINGDGRFVVFQTAAGNVVAGDANATHDVFLRDMVNRTTVRVSVTPSGGDAAGASTRPVINSDGRYIAFASNSSDLVPVDRNGDRDVFLRDMATGVTELVSVSSSGEQGNCSYSGVIGEPGEPGYRAGASGMSSRPTISADGRVVGYVGGHCTLIADDNNDLDDIYVRVLSGAGVSANPTTTSTTTVTTAPPDTNGTEAGAGTPVRSGYWMLRSDGVVHAFGDASWLGNAAPHLPAGVEAVDLEPTPSGAGYWVVDAKGNVYAFGDAAWLGNAPPGRLVAGEVVTSLSATPTGGGYWIFTNTGAVMASGDAGSHGDMSAVRLNGPVLDSIPTPSGGGYHMVAGDGGIFTFGDARFYGSMGSTRLNAPVQSLVPGPNGVGYWLVASDGGVFTFGDAGFHGSMGGQPLNRPVTGMVPFGNGYLMVAEDGGIFNFSDRPFSGSLGGDPPPKPVVAVAALDQ